MISSDELAIGNNGELVAPIDLVVHTLQPYVNEKIFNVKVDTLTNINGFESQNLSSVSRLLRSEIVSKKAIQMLGLRGFNLEFTSFLLSKKRKYPEDKDCFNEDFAIYKTLRLAYK